MAKEFNIYLKRRVYECDLIVRSLPFRDGMTASNRLILDACVEAYMLCRYASSQMGVGLEAHIDEMLKLCYEKGYVPTTIYAGVELGTGFAIYPDPTEIQVGANEMNILAALCADATSILQTEAKILDMRSSFSVGSGQSVMELSTKLNDTLKTGLMEVREQVAFRAKATLADSKADSVDLQVALNADLTNLCYRITDAIRPVMEISGLVLGTEFHYSFGRAFNSTSLDVTMRAPSYVLSTAVESVLNTLMTIRTGLTLLTYCVDTEDQGVLIQQSLDAVRRRYRLFGDLENETLGSMGDQTLDDLYYVSLDT